MAKPAEISSKLFAYDGKDKIFIGEVSALGPRFTGNSFYIRSERTGAVRLFLFSGVDEDPEEGIVAWHYILPGGDLRAVVFND
jgi:hypothetical protein